MSKVECDTPFCECADKPTCPRIDRDNKERGIVPWEADDPQPKPRMHKDFFDILVEAGVEESTRPGNPFPPLAPHTTTDTSQDRVLDAALRSHCEEERRRHVIDALAAQQAYEEQKRRVAGK